MQFRTFSSIKAEVERTLDLEDEIFIQPQEYIDYAQKAVNFLEAEIHKLDLQDNYFETYSPLRLVSGIQDYALPSNIYSNKILRILWRKSNEIFEIRRITRKDRYADIAAMELFQNSGIPYCYQILNSAPEVGPRIHVIPGVVDTVAQYSTTATITSGSKTLTVASATGIAVGQFVAGTGISLNSRVTGVSGVTITISENATASGTLITTTFTDQDCLVYYIREAIQITGNSSLVDAFEFDDFVVQHMVVSCLGKEPGNPRLQIELSRLTELKDQMISTLTEMVPDQRGDEIEIDFTLCEEMS